MGSCELVLLWYALYRYGESPNQLCPDGNRLQEHHQRHDYCGGLFLVWEQTRNASRGGVWSHATGSRRSSLERYLCDEHGALLDACELCLHIWIRTVHEVRYAARQIEQVWDGSHQQRSLYRIPFTCRIGDGPSEPGFGNPTAPHDRLRLQEPLCWICWVLPQLREFELRTSDRTNDVRYPWVAEQSACCVLRLRPLR